MTKQPTKSNEITLTRFYEAPVSAVWEAWTDPDQVGQWWGPRGFSLTTHSKDLRVGGHWHYTMHGPDGVDYVNKTKYFEVEKEAKLVYDHGGSDERKPLFRVTVIFRKVTGGTQLVMTMACPTVEDAEQTKGFIKKAGGNATWDRLGEFLTKKSTNKETFIINRAFNAPIDVMYDMWTNPEHFSKWLPPTGFNMKFIKIDLRPGGEGQAVGYGHVGSEDQLAIKQVNALVPEVPGLHIAFTARTRAAVVAFYQAAVASGGRDNGAPGLRPGYGDNYFASFVIDPEGHRLEAVCRLSD